MGDCMGKVGSNTYEEYGRDSFSDRVCDDLSEVILQYLSLEDKLRLECVSKQFQRTVFRRHYEFSVTRVPSEQYYYITKDKLELLFKKCHNISEIFFSKHFKTYYLSYSDWI